MSGPQPPVQPAPAQSDPAESATRKTPRSRTGRRLIIAAVVILAVLALVFAADRGVQTLVERRVATEVQTASGAAQVPIVDLGPWPFLTEIATGRVSTARVQLAELELPNGNGATATDVDATFSDITSSDGFSKVVAARGQATGLVSYPSLSRLTGLDLSYASPDRITVAFSVPIGRLTVAGTATGRPVLDVAEQSLAIEDAEVTVPGSEGDQGLLDAAGRLVLRSIPLGDLPYDLEVTEVTVTEAGVRFGANGENLPLR